MSRKKLNSQAAGREAAAEVYVVIRPLNYGEPEVRHEVGAEVSDIPAGSLPWLLEQGHIKLKEGDE